MTDKTEESGATSPVAHLSPAERAARGKAARTEVPRASHAEWEPSAVRARPGRAARAAGGDARARAGADPLRADARLAVHVLPRRGADHGVRSRRRRPRSGFHVQLCGDAHLSNFGDLRHARAQARVRHQRLRRDPSRARGSGTSSASPRASWSPAATAASRQAARRDRPGRRRRATGRRCASSPPSRTSRSGTRTSTSSRLIAQLRRRVRPRSRSRTTDAAVAKARTKDSMRAFAKLTHLVDGERRIISDPPLIVPIEELVRGRGLARDRRGAAGAVPRLPAYAHAPTAAGCSSSTTSSTSRARSSASAASAPAPGSRCSSGATTSIRSSCRSRRRSPRCSSRSSAAASTATAGSASSPGSG